MQKIITLTLTIAGAALAGDLLVNGNFEQDLTVGWTAYATSPVNDTINRGTGYQTDPDYESFVFKGTGSGYAQLKQDLLVPSTDLDFSIAAKIYAYDNNADTLCWAAAAVVITYKNDLGNRLGETRICRFTAPCPWVNNSTTHLIAVGDSLWHNYAFNLDNELTNLPGVNPALVKSVSIAVYDTVAHTC